ncbi:uncharacterized protein BJ212DRAFT_574933 [Suillus subaureus]|uniref:Uncharacterized protein n=1 Tax=Suillus subaureus TaxID=48587 RepID=A0A9P7E4D3_9AGAM|nr:uncharacterized protein BJ212DRAFT_574933 [Suillus subaureus]KAG1810907.1 hypothetical protein BJ212DRAFT_574933 [Suillus subaureus]
MRYATPTTFKAKFYFSSYRSLAVAAVQDKGAYVAPPPPPLRVHSERIQKLKCHCTT